MTSSTFYDTLSESDNAESIRDFKNPKKKRISRTSSFLRFFGRKMLDARKEDGATISMLIAQSLNVSHNIINSTATENAISNRLQTETDRDSDEKQEDPTTPETRPRSRRKSVSREKSLNTRKSRNISSLYEEFDEKRTDRKKVPQKVLRYEKLSDYRGQTLKSFSDYENFKVSEVSSDRTKVSRKLSFKPKTGTVKTLVKTFEGKSDLKVNEEVEGTEVSELSCEKVVHEEAENRESCSETFAVDSFELGEDEKETPGTPGTPGTPELNKSFLWRYFAHGSENGFSSPSSDLVVEICNEVKRRRTSESSNKDSGLFECNRSCEVENSDVDVKNEQDEQVELRHGKSKKDHFGDVDSRNSSIENDCNSIAAIESTRNSTGSDSVYHSGASSSIFNEDDSPIDDFPSSEDEYNVTSPIRLVQPFYQHYSNVVDAEARKKIIIHLNLEEKIKTQNYENERPHALDLVTKNKRTYWKDIPEVIESGRLENMTSKERKLQEAKFEIITSEASYVKSLKILEKHYMKNIRFCIPKWLSEREFKYLFGNVVEVRKSSECFLNDLEEHWQNDILLREIIYIIQNHASNIFRIYQRYSTHFGSMTRQYNDLIKRNEEFKHFLELLNQHQESQNLPLHSFVALPVQRITRLPLLLKNVLDFMDADAEEYRTGVSVLETLKKMAQECDDEIENSKKTEEMLLISQQIDFSAEVRSIPIMIKSRYLVLQSGVKQLIFRDRVPKKICLQLFLFNDLLLITKKPTFEEHFLAVDYCSREFVEAESMGKLHLLGNPELTEANPIALTLLSNYRDEKVEMLISFDKTFERQRWLEALTPTSVRSNRKTLADDFRRPQVIALNNYKALRPDELTLNIGDVISIIEDKMDGWCQGEKLINGDLGWFPAEYTAEITDEHIKKANMKLQKELRMNKEKNTQNLDRKISLSDTTV